jgi:hypothetical protein
LCYYFGHLNIVYFAVPGPVVGLSFNPGSDKIIVKWEKPGSNSDCVTNYVIEWVSTVNGSESKNEVTSDEFYTIEDLDACVEYEVSVTAVNADGNGTKAVTDKTTTGNYHTHIILLYLYCGCASVKGNGVVFVGTVLFVHF